MLLLASDIVHIGWSWPATQHAICVQVPPAGKTVEEFNRRLCAGSGLAPVLPDSIQFGSLACGHTNVALRAIAAAVPSGCPLLAEDGKLSLEKLRRKDPEFAKAVEKGLRWKVLRHEVRAMYPKALDVIHATGASRKGATPKPRCRGARDNRTH